MNNPLISEFQTAKEEWNKPELTVLDVKTDTLFDVVSPGADAYTFNS
ncbi:hypothetical protein [Sediminibacterium ginsengisoli]|uniref:Uncharacterized protein n=1 Tax=Sediminibacterium ginsengisoli TaxID=413434 RepID=A0A1T4P7Q3_9BACT|nr:hypothetical protein [Sediminibacterium ginsengisoli]SJZ87605.1 hypothetical protein SAMN04488132_105201 [Sediminibacterium ginsengisoli]